jgi:hypothetical protein
LVRGIRPALLLLAGCAPAADSGGGGDDTGPAADTAAPPDCAATPGQADAAAARQFSVVLTVESSAGGEAGGGAGLASLDDAGLLRWDLAPAVALSTTTEDRALTGTDNRIGDGSGPDGCAVDVHETTTLDATWGDAGGFVGSLTWRNAIGACGATCEVEATYTLAAMPL